VGRWHSEREPRRGDVAENKTTRNDASVEKFLASVPEPRQSDAREVCALMASVSGKEPEMWGDSIVGFGERHLVYASGRELDWFEVGFSPRKQSRRSTSPRDSTGTTSCWAASASIRPGSRASI